MDQAIWDNLRRNIGMIGQVGLQKQLTESQRKKGLQDKIKEAIATNILSGKIRMKEGADLSGIDYGGDIGQILGQVSKAIEYVPEQPYVNITQSEVPFMDIIRASEVMARSPKEWGKAGMATKEGGGFMGLGSKWKLSSEAQMIRDRAQKLITNPQRETISTRGKFTGGKLPALTPPAALSAPTPAAAGGDDLQALIDEYDNTPKTNANLKRLQELESILEARGIKFE